jgi:hypothetical protein
VAPGCVPRAHDGVVPPDVRAFNACALEQARACGAPSSEADPVRVWGGPSSEADVARGRRTPSIGAESARGRRAASSEAIPYSRESSSGPPGGPPGPSRRGPCLAWLSKVYLALLRVLSGDFPAV